MLLCMAACGNKTAAEVDTREGYETLQLSLGTYLPSITMWGTYYLNEINDQFAAEGMVASYYTDLDSEPDYDFYQWEKGDLSLEDVATKQFSKRGWIQDVSEEYKFDTWEIEGDYEFYYYASCAEYSGKTYIVQSYFFEEETSYICVDRWVKTKAIETGIDNFAINIPYIYLEADKVSSTPKELISAYYDKDQTMPMVYIYSASNGSSFEDTVNAVASEFGAEFVSDFTWTSAAGNSYRVMYMNYTEEGDGNIYNQYNYFIDLGSKYLRFNFLSFGTDNTSSMMHDAFFNAVFVK